jgi:hypothetical protein
MNLNYGLFLVAVFGFTASAQTITLNGKVTNQSGKPISGAVVTLAGKKISDTTDATGAYSINGGTVSVNTNAILPGADKISMVSGRIVLSLSMQMPVKIELFNMKGNLLDKVLNQPVSAGEYRFNIATHPLAANMMLIRVSMGKYISTFRYFPIKNGIFAGTSTIAGSSRKERTEGLLKIQATIDSLKVTASQYMSSAVAIASYASTVNITLDSITLHKFSFFVTSLRALQELSKSQNGFGGDYRFGKTGPGAGLLGADSICQCIAEKSMAGSKVKLWRAFLSVSSDQNGKQVNAIDRIGNGPWYDRTGRLLAPTIKDLISTRPLNGDVTIKNDLPNEDGIPNHQPDPNGPLIDNHHMVTGSGTDGKLYSATTTCADWTSTTASGRPRCGFAWPRNMGGGGTSGSHWISGFDANGCGAGIEIIDNGPGSGSKIIGSGGGYGGFYCFALNP